MARREGDLKGFQVPKWAQGNPAIGFCVPADLAEQLQTLPELKTETERFEKLDAVWTILCERQSGTGGRPASVSGPSVRRLHAKADLQARPSDEAQTSRGR